MLKIIYDDVWSISCIITAYIDFLAKHHFGKKNCFIDLRSEAHRMRQLRCVIDSITKKEMCVTGLHNNTKSSL